MFLEPIMILDGCFDPAVFRYFDTDLRECTPGVLQEIQIFLRSAFPEVSMKRFISDDF
jgi:hypothetical protein